jgi:hypothetical protein
MKGHWSSICSMAKQLVDIYQASIEKKCKDVETSFTQQHSLCDDDDYYYYYTNLMLLLI